jgi:hypothetical protein
MTLTQLDRATDQILHLSWRDRLVLVWRILKTLLPQKSPLPSSPSDPAVTSQAAAAQLLALHRLCQEEAYVLEIPERRDRPGAFEEQM